MEKHKCCAKIYGDFSYYTHTCGNTAKYERYGKWYCGIHDPEKVKEQQEKRDIAWKEKLDIERKRRRRIAAMEHFCEHLTVEFMETHKALESDSG